MPPKTTYEAGRIWAQIVATMVATKHPKVATVERVVRKRGAKVYVDYLQNIEGKNAGMRVQRQGECVCRRLDAGHVEGSGRGVRSAVISPFKRFPTAWPRSAISGSLSSRGSRRICGSWRNI
jgi:hypothetical protein